ncbi:hypothetical protein BV22DRAFT_421792 [Leucogyrophana mollusca]|uniref:Uncharacterized protein n=1 Tax=Leucogyrophana mollusca TaxID=85980 RepID=A0ACB8BJB9_9AGAM|nr:hypothetical protein BV22DRAFT_421792 [Leucogyrophana mollusca]
MSSAGTLTQMATGWICSSASWTMETASIISDIKSGCCLSSSGNPDHQETIFTSNWSQCKINKLLVPSTSAALKCNRHVRCRSHLFALVSSDKDDPLEWGLVWTARRVLR